MESPNSSSIYNSTEKSLPDRTYPFPYYTHTENSNASSLKFCFKSWKSHWEIDKNVRYFAETVDIGFSCGVRIFKQAYTNSRANF